MSPAPSLPGSANATSSPQPVRPFLNFGVEEGSVRQTLNGTIGPAELAAYGHRLPSASALVTSSLAFTDQLASNLRRGELLEENGAAYENRTRT